MSPEIVPGLAIPDDELQFVPSRAGGPGGQNVNKVETRMTLRFDLDATRALTPQQLDLVRSRLASRISSSGVLQVSSQKYRTQQANKEAAITRFVELLAEALAEEKPRKKSGVPSRAKEKRRDEKRRLSEKKRDRRALD